MDIKTKIAMIIDSHVYEETVCGNKACSCYDYDDLVDLMADRILSLKLPKPIKVWCEECGGSGKIQFLGAEGIPEQDLCPDCKGEGYREVETLGELLSDKPQQRRVEDGI